MLTVHACETATAHHADALEPIGSKAIPSEEKIILDVSISKDSTASSGLTHLIRGIGAAMASLGAAGRKALSSDLPQ
jgi:hypothetical protein